MGTWINSKSRVRSSCKCLLREEVVFVLARGGCHPSLDEQRLVQLSSNVRGHVRLEASWHVGARFYRHAWTVRYLPPHQSVWLRETEARDERGIANRWDESRSASVAGTQQHGEGSFVLGSVAQSSHWLSCLRPAGNTTYLHCLLSYHLSKVVFKPDAPLELSRRCQVSMRFATRREEAETVSVCLKRACTCLSHSHREPAGL